MMEELSVIKLCPDQIENNHYTLLSYHIKFKAYGCHASNNIVYLYSAPFNLSLNSKYECLLLVGDCIHFSTN